MCESLFVNLGGSGGGSIADGVLQTPAALSASLQIVKDNLGNVSPFSLSQNYGAFGGNVIGGAFSHNVSIGGYNGSLTGIWVAPSPSASNFAIIGDANFTYFNAGSGIGFFLSGAGKGALNANGWEFNGGTQNGAVSVKGLGGNILSLRNSSDVEKGYFSNAGQMHADNFLSANLGAGSLSGARKMKFGDKAAITDAALTALGLDSQIAIEHNNTVYYIPISTTIFA
jgi:hypothetical protein